MTHLKKLHHERNFLYVSKPQQQLYSQRQAVTYAFRHR